MKSELEVLEGIYKKTFTQMMKKPLTKKSLQDDSHSLTRDLKRLLQEKKFQNEIWPFFLEVCCQIEMKPHLVDSLKLLLNLNFVSFDYFYQKRPMMDLFYGHFLAIFNKKIELSKKIMSLFPLIIESAKNKEQTDHALPSSRIILAYYFELREKIEEFEILLKKNIPNDRVSELTEYYFNIKERSEGFESFLREQFEHLLCGGNKKNITLKSDIFNKVFINPSDENVIFKVHALHPYFKIDQSFMRENLGEIVDNLFQIVYINENRKNLTIKGYKGNQDDLWFLKKSNTIFVYDSFIYLLLKFKESHQIDIEKDFNLRSRSNFLSFLSKGDRENVVGHFKDNLIERIRFLIKLSSSDKRALIFHTMMENEYLLKVIDFIGDQYLIIDYEALCFDKDLLFFIRSDLSFDEPDFSGWKDRFLLQTNERKVIILNKNIDNFKSADYLSVVRSNLGILYNLFFQIINTIISVIPMTLLNDEDQIEIDRQLVSVACDLFIFSKESQDEHHLSVLRSLFSFVNAKIAILDSLSSKIKVAFLYLKIAREFPLLLSKISRMPGEFSYQLLIKAQNLVKNNIDIDDPLEDMRLLFDITIMKYLVENRKEHVFHSNLSDKARFINEYFQLIIDVYNNESYRDNILIKELVDAIHIAIQSLACDSEKIKDKLNDFLRIAKDFHPHKEGQKSPLQISLDELETSVSLEKTGLTIASEEQPKSTKNPKEKIKEKGKEKEKEKERVSFMAPHVIQATEKKLESQHTDNLPSLISIYTTRYEFPKKSKPLSEYSAFSEDERMETKKKEKQKMVDMLEVKAEESSDNLSSAIEQRCEEIRQLFFKEGSQTVIPLEFMGDTGLYFGVFDTEDPRMERFFSQHQHDNAQAIFKNNFSKGVIKFGPVKNGISGSNLYGFRIKTTHQNLGEYRIHGTQYRHQTDKWNLIIFNNPLNHFDQEANMGKSETIDVTGKSAAEIAKIRTRGYSLSRP